MRRPALVVIVGLAMLLSVPVAAKFGISKTRLSLLAGRPPERPVLPEAVYIDVRSEGPEVGRRYVSLVRSRLEDAFGDSSLYRVVREPEPGGARILVSLSDLNADLRDEIRTERKYVKVGTRKEWNEKKQKYEDKDVYEYRNEPVTWTRAEGGMEGSIEVEVGKEAGRARDLSSSYQKTQKADSDLPEEMGSESALRDYLVEDIATQAVAAVAFHTEPVEALLAVNGELKDGNRAAEAGRFKEALADWQREVFKGDTEAARLHNVGVAYEALAYALPPYNPECKDLLEKAQDHYRRARDLDPDEKYFKPPLERIAGSLDAVGEALRQREEIERYRTQAGPSRPAARAPAAPPPAAAPAPAPPTPGASAPAPEVELRNGAFERALDPWRPFGPVALVAESGRGQVAELAAGDAAASVVQAVEKALGAAASATLRLDYKVTAGEARIAVRVGYLDAQGRRRTSTLEATAGEAPGAWSSWSQDLALVRPRPERLREVRIEVEAGTVRLDNVELKIR
jgi:tetratricopeptide (TPR) repeat protein